MSRFHLGVAAATLLVGSAGGTAQADTVWHYPYKGAPFATESGSTAREIVNPRLSRTAVRLRHTKTVRAAGTAPPAR